jgi:hypothetical protein
VVIFTNSTFGWNQIWCDTLLAAFEGFCLKALSLRLIGGGLRASVLFSDERAAQFSMLRVQSLPMFNFPGVENGDYIACHLKKTKVSLFY